MTVNFQENENKILKIKNDINKLKNLMRDIHNQNETMLGAERELDMLFNTHYKLGDKSMTLFATMQTKINKDIDDLRLQLAKLEGY